jgi:hypothetical protein
MARIGKLKEGDLKKFTQDYTHVWLLRKKKIKQGQQAMVTRIYAGSWGGLVHHIDVRLPDGTLLKEVPIKYFAGS